MTRISACCLLLVLAAAVTRNERARADDGRLLFITSFAAGSKGAIQAFKLDEEKGELQKGARTDEVEHPFFLALSPKRDTLYSIHAPGSFGAGKDDEQVASFSLVGDDGELKLLNRQSARGRAACYLDVSKLGDRVLVANYATGSVAALPILPGGKLGKATAFHQHQGSSVTDRQKGPHAHCIYVGPNNRFAYAADLGLDKILIYKLGSVEKNALTPHRQPFVRTPPGAGPRHLVVHPKRDRLYVINELANSITAFAIEPLSGILVEQETISTLPKDFDGKSYCADLKITADGRFLYGTNRGHDSIAAYRIGPKGKLTLIEIIPSLGKGPQNLAISPSGKWLLCANMPGNNVAVFRIDPESGKLKAVGKPLLHLMPSCILFR